MQLGQGYLHSIMYLLIHSAIMDCVDEETFTFHNVSINSKERPRKIAGCTVYLHSIMYLLIPVLQLPLYHL